MDERLLSPAHQDTHRLVAEFAKVLADKLARAELKHGYTNDWATNDWEEECRRQLHLHIAKGDPIDVAAYAAFMWARGWSTAAPLHSRSIRLQVPPEKAAAP